MRTIVCFFFLFFLPVRIIAQQDMQINQYLFNYIYVNPAYAGYKEDFYAHSFSRNQWVGLNGAPESFAFAADYSVADARIGLGLVLTEDNIGAQKTFQANALYAYRLAVNRENRLAFGIAVGMMQSEIDGSKLDPAQQSDPSLGTARGNAIFPDAKAGIYYSTPSFFSGFSVSNILGRAFGKGGDLQIVAVPVPHYYFTIGFLMPLSEEIKLKPSVLVKHDQGGPVSADVNAFVLLKERIWLGMGFRPSLSITDHKAEKNISFNQLVAIAEMFAGDKFRIGYAFEYPLSVASGIGLSHEISIGIYLKKRQQSPIGKRCYF